MFSCIHCLYMYMYMYMKLHVCMYTLYVYM